MAEDGLFTGRPVEEGGDGAVVYNLPILFIQGLQPLHPGIDGLYANKLVIHISQTDPFLHIAQFELRIVQTGILDELELLHLSQGILDVGVVEAQLQLLPNPMVVI